MNARIEVSYIPKVEYIIEFVENGNIFIWDITNRNTKITLNTVKLNFSSLGNSLRKSATSVLKPLGSNDENIEEFIKAAESLKDRKKYDYYHAVKR